MLEDSRRDVGRWEETRREEGGPRTQGPSVPVLVPSAHRGVRRSQNCSVCLVSSWESRIKGPLSYDSSLIMEGSRGDLEF